MKNKFLSKCISGILLGSFLVTGSLLPFTSVQAATGSELGKRAELIAENDDVRMYYNEVDALISLEYKDTGRIVDTKVMNGDSGNQNYKNYQKSDFLIDYYKDSKSGNTTRVSNYDMAIEAGQMETEKIENGIKITYTLKEDKLSMDCVPKELPQEKMRELIFPYLSDTERTYIDQYYRSFDTNKSYYRQKDDGVTQSVIKELYRLFYEVGKYTQEDLEEDNTAFNHESTWNNLEITLSIEYVLDGKDLLVRIPISDFATNSEDLILNTLSVLPYFLSATSEEDGYMVVPDGSGAVINFNNGMTRAVDYVSRVYADDVLIDATSYSSVEYYANMPVIGMVYDDYAYLSIVEEGATMAEINTQISGKTDNYNKAYWKFYITEKENVATTEHSAVSVNKFTEDTFTDKIVIRYKMLEAENASYTGIAKTYQNYLIDKGVLTKNERKDSASLYLEILGAVKESKNFLGVPYQGISSLTTFSEVKQMLEHFKISGVDDMEVELTGWMNNGDSHSALTSIDLESAMGSKSDLSRIVDFAHEYEFGFYPSLNLQKVYASKSIFNRIGTSSFAGKYASKFLSSEYAQLGTGKLGLDNLRINSYSAYLVSPTMLKAYTNKVVKNLKKFSLEGLSVKDIGALLVPDHNSKDPVSREHAADIENEAVGTLADKYKIMLSNPYAYAWQYADCMTDLPSRSNEYNVFSYDIPFLQLVLDGCVSYSTTPLNYDTQKEISEMILKCIETRMNPKFYLMYADMSELEATEEHYDELSINYMTWRKDIVSLYKEYNEFYKMVNDADIESHETLYKNVVKVTYTNGVTVYVNYNKRAYMVDGHKLDASSYLIVEE